MHGIADGISLTAFNNRLYFCTAGQNNSALIGTSSNGQDFEFLINAQVGYPDPVIPVAVDFGSDASVSFDISNRAGAATSLEWSLQVAFAAEAWLARSQSFGSAT